MKGSASFFRVGLGWLGGFPMFWNFGFGVVSEELERVEGNRGVKH